VNKLRKSLGNEGFTLVELIIVIAIMAALIAILAPQYLKYVEKSRVAADKTSLDQVVSAVKVAVTDPDSTAESGTLIIDYSSGTCTIGTTGTLTPDCVTRITNSLGATTFTLKSKTAKDAVVSAGNKITITVAGSTYAVSCAPVYSSWS